MKATDKVGNVAFLFPKHCILSHKVSPAFVAKKHRPASLIQCWLHIFYALAMYIFKVVPGLGKDDSCSYVKLFNTDTASLICLGEMEE